MPYPGTNAKKTPRPIVRATRADVAWAAGFLEGEGSFRAPADQRFRITAEQNVIQPLCRLQQVFGGQIARTKRGTFVWQLGGALAYRAVDMVYPWLSERRKDQIHASI